MIEFLDGEEAAAEHLASVMVDPVGNNLPSSWTPADGPFVVVAHDGTPGGVHPIEEHQTIRVTVFARSSPEAKQVARRAHAELLAHPGGDGVVRVDRLTGVAPAGVDQTTRAHLASGTARMVVSSTQSSSS